MLEFVSFGSGSSGNCYYLGNDGGAVLIDAGINIRRLKRYMKEYGLAFSNIKAILVTHDHADHVKAVGHVSNEYSLPVYTTELAHRGLARANHARKKIEGKNVVVIEKGQEFSVAGFTVTPFDIPHDSMDNVGYCIQYGDKTFTIMTDVGRPTGTVKEFIGRTNYLVLEANYDREMLINGKYPQILKDRIMSGTGHLSNQQTAETLAECFHKDLRNVWLCHLSEENNHPELARKTVEFHLRSYGIIAGTDFKLEVLRRLIPTGPYIFE